MLWDVLSAAGKLTLQVQDLSSLRSGHGDGRNVWIRMEE